MKINLFGMPHGKIGPYLTNSYFLYGNENDANSLLEFIDNELSHSSKEDIPCHIFSKVKVQYRTNKIYSKVIKDLINYIKLNINVDEIDYISGGERRDWFFSNIIAHLLKKPHITIYKNLSCVLSDYKFIQSEAIKKIEGKNVLHIADLLNQASSYLRAWIPAIRKLGGHIKWSLACIDKNQVGTERLKKAYVQPFALININTDLFDEALKCGIINRNQHDMLLLYTYNPDKTMKKFLLDHPDFLDISLNEDAQTSKRAKLCIKEDFYQLNNR